MSLGTVGKPKVNLGSTGARTFASSKKANVYTLNDTEFQDYIMREFGILKQIVALTAEADTLGKDTIKTQVKNHFEFIEKQIIKALPFFTERRGPTFHPVPDFSPTPKKKKKSFTRPGL